MNNDLTPFKSNRSYFDEHFPSLPTDKNKKFSSPFREDKNPSCTFYQSDSKIWYIHDWSLDEQYDLIKALELKHNTDFKGTLEILGIQKPQYKPKESLNDYLKNHGITKETLEKYGCQVSEKEIKFPYENNRYKIRRIGVPNNRFYSTKGLKLKDNFFSIGQFQETINICAGEIDSIVLHEHIKEFVIGVSEQQTLPLSVIKLIQEKKSKKVNIFFDNPLIEKVSQQKINSIVQQLHEKTDANIYIFDWSKYLNYKDISEIVAKRSLDDFALLEMERNTSIPDIVLDDWDEPLDLKSPLLKVEPFDPEVFLPEILGEYVSDIAERMQCPIDFPAVATIISMGTAIGRKIGICPKAHDSWLVTPNLWGYIVGRPSLMKTPSIKEAINVLYSIEGSEKQAYESDLKDFNKNTELLKIKQSVAKDRLKRDFKAPEALTNEDDENILVEEVDEPKRKRFIVNDTTVEKLGEILSDNPNGVLLFRDELNGFFRSLDKDGREADRAFYLEAWEGTGRFTYDRISRGTIDIESVCISIFGTIQPSVLQKVVQDSQKFKASDDGLLQRFQLAVYPDNLSGEWKNIDRPPNKKLKEQFQNIIKNLVELEPASINAETNEFVKYPFLRFNGQAQEMFNEWRKELENKLCDFNGHPALESHLAKYRSLIPSLALIFHLADIRNHRLKVVGEDSLGLALAFSEYLESHAKKIYSMGEENELDLAHLLLKKIKEYQLKYFSAREIQRRNWKGLNSANLIQKAICILLEANILRCKPQEERKNEAYEVNPKILRKNKK